MVAIEDGEDVQVTADVRFWLLPSANIAVAWNWTWVVAGVVAAVGVTLIDVKAEDSTTRFALPLRPPLCAVIVTLPADCPVAAPPLTVATVGSDDVQLAD